MQLPYSNSAAVPSVFSPGGDLDYFHGRVFGGVQYAPNLVPDIFMSYGWQHPDQLNSSTHVDGTDIVRYLVTEFDPRTAQEFSIFKCRENDQIQYHFGVDALKFIKDFWNDLPADFINWASRRRLYAAADTFWGDDGHIYMPCLIGFSQKREICGHSIYLDFHPEDVLLRE